MMQNKNGTTYYDIIDERILFTLEDLSLGVDSVSVEDLTSELQDDVDEKTLEYRLLVLNAIEDISYLGQSVKLLVKPINLCYLSKEELKDESAIYPVKVEDI